MFVPAAFAELETETSVGERASFSRRDWFFTRYGVAGEQTFDDYREALRNSQ
jgi:hypothetical protein